MQNFSFWNPTRIHFGQGQIDKLSKEIAPGSKVLLAYGGGSIRKNGTYQKVIDALQNFQVLEFSGIEPNPTYETLMKAVDVVRSNQIDFILAVGGGSVIDGVKFISVAAPFDQGDPWDLVIGKATSKGKKVPFGAILTLPATGTEMNQNSVVTRAEFKEKRGFRGPDLYPQFSILDPTLTYSLPRDQTANGIADAFVHVIEQYLTYPADAPLQDRMAEGILSTLIEEGPKALALPENYEVRANLMWCATMALNGLIGSGVPQDWSTHMLGHELTAEFGIAHGTTLAILLPSVLRKQKESKREKLIQYGQRVWNIQGNRDDEIIEEAIIKTQSFFEAIGIKTTMGSYGVSAPDIELFLSRLEDKGFTQLGERADITLKQSREIYQMSL